MTRFGVILLPPHAPDLGRREEKFLDPRMIAYIKRHLVHCPLAIITVFSVMCLVLAIIPVFMCSIKFHLILCQIDGHQQPL